MKNIIIITLLIYSLPAAWGQVTTPLNVGAPSDYLGWDSNTSFDLNIENKGLGYIRFLKSNSFTAMGIPHNAAIVMGAQVSSGDPNSLRITSNLSWGEKIGLYVHNNSWDVTLDNWAGFFITRANNTLFSEAVRGRVKTLTGLYNYGIYSYVCNPYGSANAIYGEAKGSHPFAGWFDGDVIYMGGWSPSDENLKTNIEPILNANEILNQLSPKSYEFNQEIENSNLPEGIQFGLIAQEVEQVVPHAVRSSIKPGNVDNDGNTIFENMEYKSVNYDQFLPLILSALQNRQDIITQQETLINELTERINNLESFMEE